jgi:enoyl-CoA hydratase
VSESLGPVTVTWDGVIAVVVIDDGKVNALSFELMDTIADAMGETAQSAASIVLAGRDETFSAGFDMAVMRSGDQDLIDRFRARAVDFYKQMLSVGCPVVAACAGHALAGGAMLLLTADLRIGQSGSAKIGFTEATVGVPLSAFGHALAARRLSRRHYIRATTLGYVTDAETAIATGFLDEVVEGDLAGAALERARALSTINKAAFAISKQRAYASVLAI